MKSKLLVCFVLVFSVLVMSGTVATADGDLFIMKGDLHLHTTFSHDAQGLPEQVIADSITAGYDFVSFTEHNTTAHLREDHSTDELIVIAGYEHTTDVAHMNIYGLRDLPRRATIYTKEEMEEYLEPLRERGGIFQLNHPNSSNYYSRFGYDIEFDFLEILNGTFSGDDRKTLNDYQDLLVDGRRLIATGGTDAHRNYTERTVYNNVLVLERSEEAILEGLLAGRNFVTVEADGPIISMSSGETIMGGTVHEQGQDVEITIGNMDPDTIVRVYTSNGMIVNDIFDASDGSSYHVEIPTEGITFVRVELWYDEDSLCAFSNPIYIEL